MTPDSACSEDSIFQATLAAQIPPAQRAPEDAAELVAEVTVLEEERLARIVVFDRVLQSEAGARELPLSSRRCDKVGEAVSLVLAVLVEAGRGALEEAEEAAKESTPRVPPEPAAPAEPVAPLRRSTRPKKRPRPVWRGPPAGHDLSAAAGVGLGLLPSFVPGVTAGWGIRPSGTWPIWLHATAWKESESDDRRGRFTAMYGGLLTCPLARSRGRIYGRVCPTLAVGGMWAVSQGFDERTTVRRPLLLAGIEASGSVKLVGPLLFTMIGRIEAVPIRARFVYQRVNGSEPQIHTPSVVVGSLFAGLALRFR